MPDNLHELVSRLIVDTKGTADASLTAITKDSSIWAFLPELILCATIVVILFVKVFKWGRRVDVFYIFLGGAVLALVAAAPWTHLLPESLAGQLKEPSTASRMEIFTGMLVYDTFSVFVRSLLLLFVVLFAFFTRLSGIPDRDDGPDVYTLVLGSTLGMCLMVSANHLLMVFMAVEMASVPSYALAGLMKGKRKASEAALKYSIYGAGAAGVMLYGISLIAGLLNTAHLPTMTVRLAELEMGGGELIVLALGGLMIMVGLAFKLSAVPFHFWCPDVFEGATAEVNAFLSVASKAAALALLVRVAVSFSALAPTSATMDDFTADNGSFVNPSKDELKEVKYFAPGVRTAIKENEPDKSKNSASDESAGSKDATEKDAKKNSDADKTDDADESTAEVAADSPLSKSRDFFAKMVAFFAIITCTFGNLAAYGQTNIKRLMAYSTIAHAGYMMMAVPALLAVSGLNPDVAQTATAGLCIYLGVYLFMNLGVFAIIAFLRNAMHSEEIADYAGLIKRSPVIAICLTVLLFSLIGLPPLAGFIGKFAVFSSLADSYSETQIAGQPATYLMVLLFVGGINTAISLFYYLRIARVMIMDPEPDTRRPFTLSWVSLPGFYVVLIVLPIVFLFFFWNGLSEMAFAAARHLLS